MTRAPRSVLYVPASNERRLEKAVSAGADLIIVDLEDGVAPAEKDAAREHVRQAVDRGLLGGRPWMLRVNAGPIGPPPADLTLVGYAHPPAVVLPKAEDPQRAGMLAARFAEHGTATALMIESARGVASAKDLAGAHPSVRMLILGSADLRLSLGARPDERRSWERHALGEIVIAARMHGAAAIDSVYFHYRDDEGLKRHAVIARDLGFDGKSCIHPSQIEPIHEVYARAPEEIAWAERVLAAWRDGEGDAHGIVTVDGEMIEALHVTVARRILGEA
ncbi:MAG TPA: CoA ester lyase [Candidatus Polarisedimenticolaceae bacterium]|nr:CoA ester lyase [Candidatus Polarisedimenticolaceae bacterium]